MPLVESLALAIHLVAGLPERQSRQYADLVHQATRDNEIDPWMVLGIIQTESRFHRSVVRHERDGTCSVGLMQVNIKDCSEALMAELQDPAVNIRRGVGIMLAGRRYCYVNRGKCPKGPIGIYNPRSKEYASRVLRKAKEMKHAGSTRPKQRKRAPVR